MGDNLHEIACKLISALANGKPQSAIDIAEDFLRDAYDLGYMQSIGDNT